MNSTNCDKKSGEILSQKLVDGYQNHLIEVQHAKENFTKHYWRHMYFLCIFYLLFIYYYILSTCRLAKAIFATSARGYQDEGD